MGNNSFKLFFLLFSFTLVLACSKEDAKNDLKNEVASRPNVPITSSEVQIGTQIWMSKNLNVSRYRNGDPIPQVEDQTEWIYLTNGAWCYYNNDSANGRVYGKLYNWYAVNDPRGLAPQDWHVPNDDEWNVLTNFLGGIAVAGGKMKAITGWYDQNSDATNSSGFTGLPGGSRDHLGHFEYIEGYGAWWSSLEYGSIYAYNRGLYHYNGYIGRVHKHKSYAFSVRCVKN